MVAMFNLPVSAVAPRPFEDSSGLFRVRFKLPLLIPLPQHARAMPTHGSGRPPLHPHHFKPLKPPLKPPAPRHRSAAAAALLRHMPVRPTPVRPTPQTQQSPQQLQVRPVTTSLPTNGIENIAPNEITVSDFDVERELALHREYEDKVAEILRYSLECNYDSINKLHTGSRERKKTVDFFINTIYTTVADDYYKYKNLPFDDLVRAIIREWNMLSEFMYPPPNTCDTIPSYLPALLARA